MDNIRSWFFVYMLLLLLSACSTAAPASRSTTVVAQDGASPTEIAPTLSTTPSNPELTPSHSCVPTNDDGVSPSYKPNTPVRSRVGHGHVLSGLVRSSRDCQPIAHAQLELWPEEGDRGHPDTSRGTVFSDQDGQYRFECNPPEHIHMRISAARHRTIGVNSYHPQGQATGTFDIVLVPEQP